LLDARGCNIGSRRLRHLLQALDHVSVKPGPHTPTRLHPDGCGQINFERARFEGHADFLGLRFPGEMLFDGAKFTATADFGLTVFGDHADFDHVIFEGDVNFRGAVFRDHAGFEESQFRAEALFTSVTFVDNVDFDRAIFERGASMDGAKFLGARRLGSLTVDETVTLQASEFAVRTAIEIRARDVNARSLVLADGGRISLHGGSVELAQADLGRASTLEGAEREEMPLLVDLSGAQVAGLSISQMDLSECRFRGTHGLERLNIDASCEWLTTPESHWCINRQMIAEEDDWRRLLARDREKHRFWRPGIRWHTRKRETPNEEHALNPEQLAGLYRALRKAREDNNDQAGASDLYYGEMEMRRRISTPQGRAKLPAWIERFVIHSYWLIAGYGMRASRSLFALSVVIALAAGLFARYGFQTVTSYWCSLLFAAQSSLEPIHPPEATLSPPGEVMQLALRLIGPILVGLTILALRSRIKR
jgi:uncharacterized protein YjbI with pentapeptide repeats